MRFQDKVAIITGGGAGIGAATARILAAEGANIVIFDLTQEDGERVAAELGKERARFIPVDVADAAAIEAAIHEAHSLFGGIDILVNNAGRGCLGKSPELPIAEWNRVMAVDVTAVFYACRVVIPLMRRRGGGAIVNTASISGLAGDYGFTAYNAAKAAVINYTRALAVDHAAENIRVNAICPGLIDTQLTAGLRTVPELLKIWVDGVPMKRAGKPEEMAAVIAFLASEAASYVTGAVIVADGGKMAWTGQPDVTLAIHG